MKKTMIVLSSVALVGVLLVGGGIWFLISRLTGAVRPVRTDDVKTYLAEHWDFYSLRAWDPQTGLLELDCPQRFTFEQMEKYGAELDFTADALAQTEHLAALRRGLAERCGVKPEAIVVYGVTTDGETAYTVDEAGNLTACWLPPEQNSQNQETAP